jgi:hypothetical protein
MSRFSDNNNELNMLLALPFFFFLFDDDREAFSLIHLWLYYNEELFFCFVFEQIFVPYYTHLFLTHIHAHYEWWQPQKICATIWFDFCLSRLSFSDVCSLSEAFSSLYTLYLSTRRSIYNKQNFSSGEAYVHRISLFFFTTCSHS